jgi:hypothetical protein
MTTLAFLWITDGIYAFAVLPREALHALPFGDVAQRGAVIGALLVRDALDTPTARAARSPSPWCRHAVAVAGASQTELALGPARSVPGATTTVGAHRDALECQRLAHLAFAEIAIHVALALHAQVPLAVPR